MVMTPNANKRTTPNANKRPLKENTMRLTVMQKKLLNNIKVMLLESCHAPGCYQVSKCPNQCSCRTRRTFALNTETAICWEIADRIDDILKHTYTTIPKYQIRDFVAAVEAFSSIARFHMSKGWETFLHDLYQSISTITYPNLSEGRLSMLKITINNFPKTLKRLKRYPK